ncbi:MAG: hypothetical protein NVS9B12_05190 [Vulcanimicrobiaceae bacterium]
MIACTIRYIFPQETDWEATRKLLRERALLYAGMPGLISKAFLLDPQSGEYGGNYVWESRAALDAFLASEMFAGARARFGEPQIRIHEIAAYLDRGNVIVPTAQ